MINKQDNDQYGLYEALVSYSQPIVKNAVRCGICGSSADRYSYGFKCTANPGHVGDLVVGIFSDLSR